MNRTSQNTRTSQSSGTNYLLTFGAGILTTLGVAYCVVNGVPGLGLLSAVPRWGWEIAAGLTVFTIGVGGAVLLTSAAFIGIFIVSMIRLSLH